MGSVDDRPDLDAIRRRAEWVITDPPGRRRLMGLVGDVNVLLAEVARLEAERDSLAELVDEGTMVFVRSQAALKAENDRLRQAIFDWWDDLNRANATRADEQLRAAVDEDAPDGCH
jgi:hypothetical protein